MKIPFFPPAKNDFFERRRIFEVGGEIDELQKYQETKLETREQIIKEIRAARNELRGKVEGARNLRIEKTKIRPERREKIIAAVEKMKSTLPAESLLMTEEIAPGTLKKLFVKNGKIDFAGNADADRKIGLGDILTENPARVRVAKPDGTTQFGVLKTAPRPGYFDGDDYLEIHDGYFFEIVEEKNLPEAEKKKTENYKKPSDEVLKIAREKRLLKLVEIKEKSEKIKAELEKSGDLKKTLLKMSAAEIYRLTRNLSPSDFRKIIKESKLDTISFSENEVQKAIARAVEKKFPNLNDEQKNRISRRLFAITGAETSARKQFAVSATAALGPFQIIPGNFRKLGENPFSLDGAAKMAATIFRGDFRRASGTFEQKLNLATMAYFAGFNRAKNRPDEVPKKNHDSANSYLAKVLEKEREYFS